MRRPRVTGSEAWDDRSRTLRRVVFGFKIFGRRSGPLIEVDVDALANAAAMKMVLFPLLEWNLSFEAACTDWTSYVENNRPNRLRAFKVQSDLDRLFLYLWRVTAHSCGVRSQACSRGL